MKIVQKKLADLKPLEQNVRRHTNIQINEYIRSLKMFGQLRPMIVDEDGVIWVGNGMYEAMKAMQMDSAECYVLKNMSEKQKKKLMLADNRVFELGMTDTNIFEEIVKSLDGDTDIPGWDADLLETLNATISEVNEMVDSYGSYDPDEVARYDNTRERPAPEAQPVQQPVQSDGRVYVHPEGEAPGNDAQGPETGFVICPQCGTRIALGGV